MFSCLLWPVILLCKSSPGFTSGLAALQGPHFSFEYQVPFMAIEVEGCQAVCSSIAEDLPVLYTLYCEADSSEPLSEGVADLALLSPPVTDAEPQGEDESSAVLSAHGVVVLLSSDAVEECDSTEPGAESVVEAAVESPLATSTPFVITAKTFDVNTFGSRSCFESENLVVECGTTTTPPSLMCNNSAAGPAVAAAPPSVLAVCAGFFLDNDSEDSTTVPWSPSMEPGLELTMDAMPATVNQDKADAEEEEELHELDRSEAQEFATGEVAEESSALEQETAETDMDSVKQSVDCSDDMELSFNDSFIEKVDSESGDLETRADGTFAVLELLDDDAQMEDTMTGSSDDTSSATVPDSCVADDSNVNASTAATHNCATDDYNTCDVNSSDNCSSTATEEGNIMSPKITAAIVVQSNTSYMGNSSSDDDEEEEDGEVESSDCESLLGRDSPSPPSVDDSSLFPSVEEVETRTGISFESSGGPSCSAPSFGSVAGVAASAASFSSSNTADTRRKAITLIDHHFRHIIDVERDLRRYVLHKTNLNRLYQEIREEKLSSHRRQRSNHHHHHHQQHHHHSAAQTNSNNVPSFLSSPPVSPLTARASSPLPFGDSGHLNPQSYNRSGAPFATMGGEPGSGSSPTFCRQSVYSGQASDAHSYGGQHEDCQDALLEPAPKRARLSCPAEEDKENKFSSASRTASVFGSGGDSYTPVTGAEFYHHQVGCSSVSGAPSSSCSGDVTTTTSSTTHYSGCNSAGSGNGYYQNQAAPAYGAYYNNNSYYANNMSYTPNGHFLGNFSSSSSDSNGTCNLPSGSNSSTNGSYAMATGPVEADAYNNVSNNNCNNVNSLDRGLAGFNNNLSSSSSSSCSDSIGFRSNNDIIIEHIDEEIRRQNSITSNNRPSSCPPFSSSSSSSSLFSSSSIFSSSSYYSQSLSSSQASSSSTPSLYNTGNSSLQYNNLNHFGSGAAWNSSYAPLYGGTSNSSSGPTHSTPPQQPPLQPYPCGRSSLMRGGNDFQSVVYSSLLASLET